MLIINLNLYLRIKGDNEERLSLKYFCIYLNKYNRLICDFLKEVLFLKVGDFIRWMCFFNYFIDENMLFYYRYNIKIVLMEKL